MIRGLDRWLPGYLATIGRRRVPRPDESVHLLLCIADHFEPRLDAAAESRVERWVTEYPRLFDRFRDADGLPPRHSFFYPAEEYSPQLIDRLAGLCRRGYGEVEIHLHHDADTSAGVRRTLTEFKTVLAERHGLLARHRQTGEVGYAFIHGNWALDNSHPDGRWCGVNDELDILRETGCYVDMTLPSAPSPCQTRTINAIYDAVDDPQRPKSHDIGVPLGSGPRPERGLLMIQGPLVLDWSRRRWGLVPRVENGCLQGSQPPTAERVDRWLSARIQVPTCPDWFFVKLHAHGCDDRNIGTMLGEPMVRFHEALAARAAANPLFQVHYVTARELANLAIAAADGWTGDVVTARDYAWRGALTK